MLHLFVVTIQSLPTRRQRVFDVLSTGCVILDADFTKVVGLLKVDWVLISGSTFRPERNYLVVEVRFYVTRSGSGDIATHMSSAPRCLHSEAYLTATDYKTERSPGGINIRRLSPGAERMSVTRSSIQRAVCSSQGTRRQRGRLRSRKRNFTLAHTSGRCVRSVQAFMLNGKQYAVVSAVDSLYAVRLN